MLEFALRHMAVRRAKLLMVSGSGQPAARQRNVTAWARVQVALGLKVRPSPVPPVMPFSAAHKTAS